MTTPVSHMVYGGYNYDKPKLILFANGLSPLSSLRNVLSGTKNIQNNYKI